MESKPSQKAERPAPKTRMQEGGQGPSQPDARKHRRDRSSPRRDKPTRGPKKAFRPGPIKQLLERAVAQHRPFQTILDFLTVREMVMLQDLSRWFKREVIVSKFIASRKTLIYSETLNYKLTSRFLKLFGCTIKYLQGGVESGFRKVDHSREAVLLRV